MYHFRQLLLPQDELLVALTHTNPDIYAAISDDYSPSSYDYKVSNKMLHFGAYKEDDTYLGGWSLEAVTGSCVNVHTVLLPVAWGKACEIGKEFETWLWKQFPQFNCLISYIPESNKLAMRLAMKCGFEKWGFIPLSIKKGGEFQGMHLVGKFRENN